MKAVKAETLLLRPTSVAAMALLGLNDHVLKAVAPGFWTGKLSDFAGLYFFPFFLVAVATLVGRTAASRRSLGAACLMTALVFACINLSSTASCFYERIVTDTWCLLGVQRAIRHVSDAEDLIALPMAAMAYFVGAKRLGPGQAT